MSTLVSSPTALAAITRRARQCGLAAIDTEFVWTRTYYPVLGIIQVGLPDGEVHLIDAPALTDTAPLAELLAAPDVVKILHDASGDLIILQRLCGVQPRGVFDARLAAGFCGLGATLSLAKLLQALLGIELAKTESRTDWLARPLTPAQVEYATDDVRHMPEMYACLKARLHEYGNAAWAGEEMGVYDDPGLYTATAPRDAYRDVKGMGRLTSRQLNLLRELTAWREQRARDKDRPRGRILRDDQLIDLALRPPASLDALRQGWWGRVREYRRDAEALWACVAAAEQVPPEQWPRLPRNPLPSKILKDRADAVLALVRQHAEARGIDPTLVAPRRHASSLVLAAARGRINGHPLLQGWCGELLSAALQPLLASWPAVADTPALFDVGDADSLEGDTVGTDVAG